ncbi:glycoside hydrolase [Seonamhaeicola sp. ML3]|uniref:glycoside hydrolase family 113 n=1 Tax=Seonamhaeicola sp. ML3 TaxID=2937786 RepID=UPI0020107268|nr:glycoside hydrolase [Seonamhaeicola sp. ML3]
MKHFKLLFFVCLCCSCNAQTQKINGVSFVASRAKITTAHVKPVTAINVNYAAVMPFGFIRDLKHPEIVYNTQRQWFGETAQGVKQYVAELRKQHLKIMLKPQIWVWRGEFTGFIEMQNETDWKQLEDSYSKFILDYAMLGQQLNVDILCIGTELERFIANRPAYWFDLIKKIKAIYNGKLTYAANWDEFKRTPFWGALDFVGIDAYFPVSNSKTPTLEECLKGWKPHLISIKKNFENYGKPILFTEFGYRSVDFAGKEPWRSDRSMTEVNLKAQYNATEALFETFWKEEWFAGGFVWKWFHNHETAGGENNSRFTPQNKPTEALIKKYYD